MARLAAAVDDVANLSTRMTHDNGQPPNDPAMNPPRNPQLLPHLRLRWLLFTTVAAGSWCAVTPSSPGATAGPQKTFASPQDAVRAVAAAAAARDTNALASIFGPAYDDVVSPDPVQAENELNRFASNIATSNRLNYATQSRCILETGTDLWPFPIPIVRTNASWVFDTAAGKEEVLNRRVGRNELSALESIRAYVDAQREYASKDRDGHEVLKYAQRFLSTPGTKDGLYWPEDSDTNPSPLGPLIAKAHSQGYIKSTTATDASPEPFHGYFYRILTRQGKHAPGGKYDYIINGNMIGGFGLIAWPAVYGDTGIMTFIVNQQGKVYQRDLGPRTKEIVSDIQMYDPDSKWTLSHE
jgi:Protein of unknown function (DUF2950)